MPLHTEGRRQGSRKNRGRKTSSSNVADEFTGTVVGIRGPQGNQFNVNVRGKTRKYKIGRGVDGRMALTPDEIRLGATVLLRKETRGGGNKKKHHKIIEVL